MNPQIYAADVELCQGLRSLQELNAFFPNMKSLYYRPKNETDLRQPNDHQAVHFANVKSYTIDLTDYYTTHRQYDNNVHA